MGDSTPPDILVDRMKREFGVKKRTSESRVAYRETIRRVVEKHDFTHKSRPVVLASSPRSRSRSSRWR
jgi:translation elongation factor EF-G